MLDSFISMMEIEDRFAEPLNVIPSLKDLKFALERFNRYTTRILAVSRWRSVRTARSLTADGKSFRSNSKKNLNQRRPVNFCLC